MDAKQLYGLGENLFTKRQSLTSLWQEIADNFYPERADFTVRRSLGDDFASNLMTSYPVLTRRDLGNQFSTMLRPTARPWFHTKIRYLDNPDNDTKIVLERMEETQRRAMYDRAAQFTRASKEGDHDFAAFGQCVKSVEMNKNADGLLYRCWHLRDVAWQENEDGDIGGVFRKWKPTVQQASRTFPGRLHQKSEDLLLKDPYANVHYMHMVVDADMYDGDAKGKPRWSVWYDYDNHHIIEAVPIWGKIYIIPRWQTVSGSQYAYSPATVAGLPDGRLLQAMTFTLLEAGEKATNPPIVATQDAVRSDVAIYAGGITWVDQDYDERLGDALRPMTQDFRGLNFGAQMSTNAQAMIHKAFFLDDLTMPERGPEMTAYEVGQRVQAYIRSALPIFEPMEQEDNAAICDETFDLLLRNGGFGDPRNFPGAMQGREIEFTFESPLHDAIEQQKTTKYTESMQLLAESIALDPSLAALPKAEVALRDALTGMGVPSKWLNSEADVAAAKEKAEMERDAQAQLALMNEGADVAQKLGVTGQQGV